MKIINPTVELVDEINSSKILKKIEKCGRVCYQSQPRNDSAEKFVRMLIKRGHESVLEHVSLTFRIICDRGILAELTRHRLASFSVESTRYVKYDDLQIIKPSFLDDARDDFSRADSMLFDYETHYDFLIRNGYPPEEARAVLPMCLKTELYMTANLREWRHILKLRTDKAAHPQMRQVAGMILSIFKEKLPVIVEDISSC